MAIIRANRGFALLIAVIFMSVMLSLGLVIGSIAYKQSVLASNSVESQYAFYAADAALECALYADQKLGDFAFPASKPSQALLIKCNNTDASYTPDYPTGVAQYSASIFEVVERLDLGNSCADVTIYKYPEGSGNQTYIFAQGYNVSCADLSSAHVVSRGLDSHY